MLNQSAYTAQIRACYPDLAINSVTLNHNGQYNDVLIINDALVFRFAKVPAAIETLREEIMILRALQGQLPLPVPAPTYVNVDSTVVGEVYMGYRLLPGKPLWWRCFGVGSDIRGRQTMAHQIGHFLYALHHVADHTIPDDVRVYDTRKMWVNMYHDFESKLFSFMRPDARQTVNKHFADYFAGTTDMVFTPCLRHGDFGPENMLHDPARGEITGILDFGAVGLGDPATDFAGMYISLGEDFYREAAVVYPEMLGAMKRVQFYIGTFALQEALFGYENDDEDAFKAGMQTYI